MSFWYQDKKKPATKVAKKLPAAAPIKKVEKSESSDDESSESSDEENVCLDYWLQGIIFLFIK